MSIVGEDALEALGALDSLIHTTEDKLLRERGFVFGPNESIKRGDTFYSRGQAIGLIRQEIDAEKKAHYIRFVIPGLLADAQVPKNLFTAPFDAEKALTVTAKLVKSEPVTPDKPMGSHRDLVRSNLRRGEFTTKEMAAWCGLPPKKIGPVLSQLKTNGEIEISRTCLDDDGRMFYYWRIHVKEKPTLKQTFNRKKANLGRFWSGSDTCKILELVKGGPCTAKEIGEVIGQKRSLTSTISKLIRQGFIRAENVPNGYGSIVRNLHYTGKPYTIGNPPKIARSADGKVYAKVDN